MIKNAVKTYDSSFLFTLFSICVGYFNIFFSFQIGSTVCVYNVDSHTRKINVFVIETIYGGFNTQFLPYFYNIALSSADRIHISATTKELLDGWPAYNIEERGTIEVKVALFLDL